VIVAKKLLVAGSVLATPEIHGSASAPRSLVSMPWALQRLDTFQAKDFRRDRGLLLISIADDPTGEKKRSGVAKVLSDEGKLDQRPRVDGRA
jgi:hypothetical protein